MRVWAQSNYKPFTDSSMVNLTPHPPDAYLPMIYWHWIGVTGTVGSTRHKSTLFITGAPKSMVIIIQGQVVMFNAHMKKQFFHCNKRKGKRKTVVHFQSTIQRCLCPLLHTPFFSDSDLWVVEFMGRVGPGLGISIIQSQPSFSTKTLICPKLDAGHKFFTWAHPPQSSQARPPI